jgi:hypothetical protein
MDPKGGGDGMNKAVRIAMALLLVFAVAGAWAEELQGKVRSVDQAERAFVLEDGTRIWVAEGLSIVTLKEGASVNALYEERDGRKITTRVTITHSEKPAQ